MYKFIISIFIVSCFVESSYAQIAYENERVQMLKAAQEIRHDIETIQRSLVSYERLMIGAGVRPRDITTSLKLIVNIDVHVDSQIDFVGLIEMLIEMRRGDPKITRDQRHILIINHNMVRSTAMSEIMALRMQLASLTSASMLNRDAFAFR